MKKIIKIGKKKVGKGQPVFFIADVGANHNASLKQAKKLVKLAASCEVDAVKFQSYRAEYFINAKQNPEGYRLIKKYQMPIEWNAILKDYCRKQGVLFMTTPFDMSIVDYLEKINITCYKIASCDITFERLLKKVAETGKPTIISTGGASVKEIKNAVKIFEDAENDNVILLHAVVNYPALYEEVNLLFMPKLKKIHSGIYGLSDHSMGNEVSIAACALGAKVIERHFTESRRQNGPDHKHSIEPKEFESLIRSVRIIEKSLGLPLKKISQNEKNRIKMARRAVYARNAIKTNRVIGDKDVIELRPKGEIGFGEARQIIGVRAKRDIRKLQVIRKADLKWEK